MINMKTGMPARSLAGHDRGKLYIIIRAEAEYVWVADGRCHTAAKPKKKNRKHIQAICRIPEAVEKALTAGEPLTDRIIISGIEATI